jgi:hypothetical protein
LGEGGEVGRAVVYGTDEGRGFVRVEQKHQPLHVSPDAFLGEFVGIDLEELEGGADGFECHARFSRPKFVLAHDVALGIFVLLETVPCGSDDAREEMLVGVGAVAEGRVGPVQDFGEGETMLIVQAFG